MKDFSGVLREAVSEYITKVKIAKCDASRMLQNICRALKNIGERDGKGE